MVTEVSEWRKQNAFATGVNGLMNTVVVVTIVYIKSIFPAVLGLVRFSL